MATTVKEVRDWLLGEPFDAHLVIKGNSLHCLETGRDFKIGAPPPVDYTPKREELTCFTCGLNKTCPFAWDDYNTGGDCLAEK